MTIKRFLLHLLAMLLFIALVLFLVFMWLKFYTNHGQKLELPNYIGAFVDEAQKNAQDESFTIIVNDSLHIVGEPGGKIISQNPKPGALVKENRKIYVDVTKYAADEYSLENDLPRLYGQEFNRTKDKLILKKINSEIDSYRYDRGEPNHILQVIYEGKNLIVRTDNGENIKKPGVKIKKGATLKFVLSKSDGALVNVPDWTCKRLKEVRFLSSINKLKIGKIEVQGVVTNKDSAFIVSQFPPSDGSTIQTGKMIDLVIAGEKPADCQ